MPQETFENKFPELIKLGYYVCYRNGKEDLDLTTSITSKDVFNNCLSKQKVKEAIENSRNHCYGNPDKLKELLLKELGLLE
jgi:hypothetical protein